MQLLLVHLGDVIVSHSGRDPVGFDHVESNAMAKPGDQNVIGDLLAKGLHVLSPAAAHLLSMRIRDWFGRVHGHRVTTRSPPFTRTGRQPVPSQSEQRFVEAAVLTPAAALDVGDCFNGNDLSADEDNNSSGDREERVEIAEYVVRRNCS
jgi:hypothetical protein